MEMGTVDIKEHSCSLMKTSSWRRSITSTTNGWTN
jgi:hypothetical protein